MKLADGPRTFEKDKLYAGHYYCYTCVEYFDPHSKYEHEEHEVYNVWTMRPLQ